MITSEQIKALREQRLSKGINQVQLAKEIGIHRTNYNNYENGKRPFPKAVYLAAEYAIKKTKKKQNNLKK